MHCVHLINLEKHVGLGPVKCAALLGVAYSAYAAYRSGRRELKLYHLRHIGLLRTVPKDVLQDYIDNLFDDEL